MFFIFGITQKDDELDYNSKLIIHNCGQYGRTKVYITYMTLSIFFIPTFKWNKKYYVKYTCCGDIYELDPTVGHLIEEGHDVKITDKDLLDLYYKDNTKYCKDCNIKWSEDYDYCPKCGRKL